MPDDRETRLLDALHDLRQLAREMHEHRHGSSKRVQLEERLAAQRKVVEALAAEIADGRDARKPG